VLRLAIANEWDTRFPTMIGQSASGGLSAGKLAEMPVFLPGSAGVPTAISAYVGRLGFQSAANEHSTRKAGGIRKPPRGRQVGEAMQGCLDGNAVAAEPFRVAPPQAAVYRNAN